MNDLELKIPNLLKHQDFSEIELSTGKLLILWGIIALDPIGEEKAEDVEETPDPPHSTEEVKEEVKEKRNNDLEGIIDDFVKKHNLK